LEIAFGSLSSSSACLSPLFPAAGAVRRPPAALGRPRPNPTSPPLHVAPPRASGPSSPRAGAPSLRHAAQNRLAAATVTPPWRARCSNPDHQFARASEPRAPQPSFPPLLCPLAAPKAPERCCPLRGCRRAPLGRRRPPSTLTWLKPEAPRASPRSTEAPRPGFSSQSPPERRRHLLERRQASRRREPTISDPIRPHRPRH